MRDLAKPVGVARYVTRLVEKLPTSLKDALPAPRDIEAELGKTKDKPTGKRNRERNSQRPAIPGATQGRCLAADEGADRQARDNHISCVVPAAPDQEVVALHWSEVRSTRGPDTIRLSYMAGDSLSWI